MNDHPRYEDITETTGSPLTTEAAEMMYTRYALAAGRGVGRRVLELGCGAGLGLGLVSQRSRLTVGADYSAALLTSGRAHYGDRVPLVRLSAEALPFEDASFDLVLFFEASYYVRQMEEAFDEVSRVLAERGEVIFVNANPERPDFVKSPFSVHYHSSDEFRKALHDRGFSVTIEGGFPVTQARGSRGRRVGWVLKQLRRIAAATGLIPKTLKGRARLKRVLFREMRAIPPELPSGFASVAPLTMIGPGAAPEWKVLYVRAARR